MNILSLFKLTIILIFCFSKISISEPFVVLEYRGQIDRGDNSSDNLFLRDLNYSSKHTVLKNETLIYRSRYNSREEFKKSGEPDCVACFHFIKK